MNCPFCGNKMKQGTLSGDGRSKIHRTPDGENLSTVDKITDKGQIDAEYSLAKFKIVTNYCPNCKK